MRGILLAMRQSAPGLHDRIGRNKDFAVKTDSRVQVAAAGKTEADVTDNERELVQSARTQLATSRQQLLATMVLMGINRIVVTDGKIQAKIMYDFQARDNTRRQRSAAAMDYARDQSGNVQRTYRLSVCLVSPAPPPPGGRLEK